jgi:hypothetical protein
VARAADRQAIAGLLTGLGLAPGARQTGIHDWTKVQELRSGAGALWRPGLRGLALSDAGAAQALAGYMVSEAQDRAEIARLLARFASAPAPAARLEVYDWPGEFAQRFDGVD